MFRNGTGQGLFKPDVTDIGGYWVASVEAPGTASVCSGSVVQSDCPTPGQLGYCSDTGADHACYNGTSISCPLTAGLGGVVLQDVVVNRGVASPRPSLVKAPLISGARGLQPSACDYTFDVSRSEIHEGWGFVQTKSSLYGPGGGPAQRNIELENEVSANALATGGSYSRQVTATAGTPFNVTLVWTDLPASAGSGSPLVVNDLDLEISGPEGTFLGSNFSGNWSVTGGSADRYNVLENVYIQNPAGGTYTITVKGFQVSQDQEPGKAGVNQDFSLVWSGDLGQCNSTCGNNSIECAELCDVSDLGGQSCQSQGFDDGTLACDPGCGAFDTSGRFDYICGDGVKNGSEECDGADLAGATCADKGCTGCPTCDNDGTCEAGENCANCTNDCISGTTSGASCGNGICEAADGEDCNSKTNGNPSTRYCCGDGTRQPPEDSALCDGNF